MCTESTGTKGSVGCKLMEARTCPSALYVLLEMHHCSTQTAEISKSEPHWVLTAGRRYKEAIQTLCSLRLCCREPADHVSATIYLLIVAAFQQHLSWFKLACILSSLQTALACMPVVQAALACIHCRLKLHSPVSWFSIYETCILFKLVGLQPMYIGLTKDAWCCAPAASAAWLCAQGTSVIPGRL